MTPFFARRAWPLVLALLTAAAQASPIASPAPSSAPATATAPALDSPCAQWIARLPGIGRAQCEAAQLVASGGQSQQGRVLYMRDLPPRALPQPTVFSSALPSGAGLAAPGAAPDAKPLRVLVVGAIHGDELTSASLALRWIALAQRQGAGAYWRFIPVLNPDGLLARRPQRVNANGVDLNRNFDTPGWAKQAPLYWEKRTRKDPRRWPGPTALSEPETQFLHAQMHDFDPDLVVSIHAPYGVLDFDGPHDPPQRLGRLRLDRVGIFPGSLGHYGSVQQGMPVVTIELDHALRLPKDGEIHAMWQDLLQWMQERLQTPGATAVGGR